MSLFQKSVVLKHLQSQNKTVLQEKWQQFQNHFHNLTIQENIRNSKEEQYQGEFLIDLFVAILGYTKNPQPDFNLTTEYKNVKDSKKADGAIVINQKVTAVIELKGTNTTDLGKIETQAFGYKNNQPDCVYVITSNFEKLRFYIDNAIEHLEFNLFKLTQEEFNLLYLCLAHENISKDIARKIKNESVSQEDVITKKLYKDYSLFKRELYQNMVALNPEYEPLELFKKSQKLLDRFLFVFFAEDRNLLPTNLIFRINKEWKQLREMRIEVSLYDRYKIYFNDLNSGAKVSLPAFSETVAMVKEEHQIFAYNGGLFKPDEMLDNIRIDDVVLFSHTEKLSHYDFASEVDVNILGHIFENSLNELDETKAQLEGQEIDKTKTKRKKDGVFYTPKYITKYIVENTIGKLCIEKKTELQLVEEDYTTDKKRQKKTMQGLVAKLEDYRKWLLQLTICDPACGSGAFLNQALDFLIEEHRYVDELQAKLFGDALVLSDIETSILENNLFGVDLNDESVEIAKLSLWLRTAQPNRKLNDLNSNIKCGNSLIDDPEVAGDKAFNWQEAFPQVFTKGGFDVIIGNPPYVQLQSMGKISDVLKNCGYETYDKGGDLYCIFTERGYTLLKMGGIQSFIMPNKWMLVAYGKPLRKFLSKTGLRQVLNFGDIQFFQEATTYVCIFVTQKSKQQEEVKVLSLNNKTYKSDFLTEIKSNIYNYPSSKFDEAEWSIQPYNDALKLEQMKLNGISLKDLPISIYRGILTGYNDAFYIDEETRQRLITTDAKSAELINPMARGRDISAYSITDHEYLIGTFPALKLEIESYPVIKEHLLSFGYDRLKQTGDKGARKKTGGNWFETQDSIKYHKEFAKPKIIYPNMTSVFPFMYDESGMLANQKCFILTAQDDSISLQFLTAVFNSSLAKLWIWYKCPELQGGTREISKVYFEHFPVPSANMEQTSILAKYSAERTQLTVVSREVVEKFQRTILRKFEITDLPKKLQDWYLLAYAEFIKELAKKKIKLSLSEEAEWEDYFNQESKKALDLKNQIDTTDKEIDKMVYELYGLSEEEILIIEEK
ncbi:Eco57I restriction-modification methylase domain-containing protein [Flavobacterium sp. M31R6]|uniref:Eco57I restriction-modification methylase domain-containing protein n=1 Tax=Flavobacterium sp. M31R6 TaxID=2739062 RepID=UPI001568520F|nr:DNA methyltransferase [Flavobacterium sp. M31R6]QKJ61737.1 N-6 DNA methylase [Flavobacterium sp. M31R6]